VLCDNMAAALMRQGRIQAVIVGSDRIAANGDVANKIGTYGVAILAHEHGIPFTCGPMVDDRPGDEQRRPDPDRAALRQRGDAHQRQQMTPDGVGIENPAFDVTPAQYVTGDRHRTRCAARTLRGVDPRHGEQSAPTDRTYRSIGLLALSPRASLD